MIQKTTTPFSQIDRPPSRFAQIVVGASCILFVLAALALMFAPRWFFENIGTFPPFNRHYEGDLGAFLFAIGAGLIYASRNPAKYRLLIAVAALGSILHALNHIFDGITFSYSLTHWLTDTAPLVIGALLLVVAWRASKK